MWVVDLSRINFCKDDIIALSFKGLRGFFFKFEDIHHCTQLFVCIFLGNFLSYSQYTKDYLDISYGSLQGQLVWLGYFLDLEGPW